MLLRPRPPPIMIMQVAAPASSNALQTPASAFPWALFATALPTVTETKTKKTALLTVSSEVMTFRTSVLLCRYKQVFSRCFSESFWQIKVAEVRTNTRRSQGVVRQNVHETVQPPFRVIRIYQISNGLLVNIAQAVNVAPVVTARIPKVFCFERSQTKVSSK